MMGAKVVGHPEDENAVSHVHIAKKGQKRWFPKNPIKEILSQECSPYQISVEAVIQIKNFLEELTGIVASLAKEKMETYNTSRKVQGVGGIKRLPIWITEEITHNLLKQIKDYNMGLQPEEIAIPQGGKMSADNSANARQKTTDDMMEVV